MATPEYMIPLTLALGDAWPSDLVQFVTASPIGDVLGKIGVVELEVTAPANVSASLKFRDELAFELPGLAGVMLVFGGDGEGDTNLNVQLSLTDPFYLGIDSFPIQLRFAREALKPVIEESPGLFRSDTNPTHYVEIGITPSIGFSGDGTIVLSGLEEVVISGPFMIADSGIVLDISSIALYLTEGDPPPDGLPEGWRGVFIPHATVHLPRAIGLPEALEFTNCGIGSGGFSGKASGNWMEAPLNARLLGFIARLKRIELDLQQNAFLRGEVEGEIELSFFKATLGVLLSIGGDGEFSATLSAVSEGGSSETPDGLIKFTQPDLLTFTVESMRLDNVNHVFRFTMSGRLKPLLADLDWPVLDVKALSIDEHGNVDIDGGWIDLPEQLTLDFHGFQITLSEMGFGGEEDSDAPEPAAGASRTKRQWLGLSGGIRLIDGLPLTAAVDGLKVSWRPDIPGGDPRVTLEGIAISLEIPKTLSLTGEVKYERLEGDDLQLTGDLFHGAVDLNLMALRTRIAGELIIGHLTDSTTGESFDVAMVVLNAEFPTAIPLGATGAGLYGLKGLLGVNIAPNRHPSAADPAELESWLEWYKADGDRGDANNVTSLKKWAPRGGHYAIGAGLTIGTVYDDGYTINAHALLAVLLPGPVIMLEGRANIIKSRSATDEGVFYLLAVLDGNAGTFQLNIGVQFELASVINIAGGAEAFFDFNDSSAWHLWLGEKEPESKRIRAEILSLFKVSAYLMVDARSFATGAKAAFELHERYGPLSIDIVAGLSFDAAISWKPAQAEGRVELVGALALKVFGFGLGIALRLLLEAKAAAPFRVHGLAHFAITLPFPLPNFDVTVEFTWERHGDPQPVWPLLKSVEFTHHLRPESRWTLSGDEAGAPVVPVDAVPVAKFARPLVGRSYRQGPEGLEFLGHDHIDEWTFTYACERTALFARNPDGSERLIAEGPITAGDISDVVPLDFSDESLIVGTDAQEPAWRLWTHERLPGASVYEREDRPVGDPACPPRIEVRKTCIDFSHFGDGQPFGREFRIGEWQFRCRDIPRIRAGRLETTDLWLRFPRAMGRVEIRLAGDVAIRAFRDGEEVRIERRRDGPQDWGINVPGGTDVLRMAVDGQDFSVQRICAVAIEDIDATNLMRRHRDTAARDTVRAGHLMLEPRTRYRLEVRTAVLQSYRTGAPTVADDHRRTNSFYFETSDGPGANPLDADERTALANCHSADASIPAPLESFPGGDPLDAVALYVDHARPGAEDDPFYYELDPALIFREAYFPEMYHRTWSLLMRARDQNGSFVGETVARRGETTLPRLSPGEVTWQAAEARSGCNRLTPVGGLTGDTMLTADGSSIGLGPNRKYVLELVLQGCFERVIYSFSLLTSRYPDPVAHLNSGIVDGEQVVRAAEITSSLTDVPVAPVSSVREAWQAVASARSGLQTALIGGSLVSIHDALEATRRAHGECDRICQEAFASITSALALTAYSPRPPRTEVVALTAADGVLLIVETAEPLEWSRWQLTGVDDAGVSREAVTCWNVDRTRAILVPREGPIGWSHRSIRLEFRYLSDAADLPEERRGGVPYEPELVELSCSF